jgi:hypothetical protein
MKKKALVLTTEQIKADPSFIQAFSTFKCFHCDVVDIDLIDEDSVLFYCPLVDEVITPDDVCQDNNEVIHPGDVIMKYVDKKIFN